MISKAVLFTALDCIQLPNPDRRPPTTNPFLVCLFFLYTPSDQVHLSGFPIPPSYRCSCLIRAERSFRHRPQLQLFMAETGIIRMVVQRGEVSPAIAATSGLQVRQWAHPRNTHRAVVTTLHWKGSCWVRRAPQIWEEAKGLEQRSD